MSRILGISAFYHDSAAALVVDGEILAAAQEERFTRIKHDHEFPTNAVKYCLEEAGIEPEDLDFVVFYDKPLQKFDRLRCLCSVWISLLSHGDALVAQNQTSPAP